MSLASGINAIDALVYNSWQPQAARTPVTLTYSFLDRAPSDAASEDGYGFAPMNGAQQQAAREAMAKWAAVAKIGFVEVAAGGNIQLGTNDQSGQDSSGYAYLPTRGFDQLQLYTSNTAAYNNVFTAGSYGPTVLLHELGHTLGLKHPGNYNSSGTSIGGPYLPAATDNTGYTLMSYHQGAAPRGSYAVTPMLYDIQAMQYLYGANTSYRSGDDTYSFSSRQAPECVWDAGGVNTFDFSACSGATLINLNAGAFSGTAEGLSNISIAYNVTIQRAIAGAGGSTIYANNAGNVISGGSGVDVIHAGEGNDQISGGEGNDTVVFARSFDSYVLSNTAAALTVLGSGQDVLTGVEFLRFSDRTIVVNDLTLQSPLRTGTDGNDLLAAAPGSQWLNGGAGIDTVRYTAARSNYTINASSDMLAVSDNVGLGGSDMLQGIERLEFSDTALAMDVDGVAGQVYRMYRSAFDRTPDLPGQGYWMKFMEGGWSHLQIADAFLHSAEFARTYGSLTDTQFLVVMYANALDRAPDQSGLEFHLHLMANGVSRAQIMSGISESPENQLAVIGLIGNGIEFTPFLG